VTGGYDHWLFVNWTNRFVGSFVEPNKITTEQEEAAVAYYNVAPRKE
jgi:hypothetical protein